MVALGLGDLIALKVRAGVPAIIALSMVSDSLTYLNEAGQSRGEGPWQCCLVGLVVGVMGQIKRPNRAGDVCLQI